MKTGLLYLGLVLSVLGVGVAYGFSEPEGVPWAEWRFTSDFDASHEIVADKASDPDSLMRRNAASSEITFSGGKISFTQTGPADYLRADVEDLVENGDGSYVNEYTMIFDLKAEDADWLPIYNTGSDNYNAAELWVASDGSVGSGAYSDPGVVPLNTWVRLVVVRRLEGGSWVRDVYVDGAKVLDGLGTEGVDGNASLYTNAQEDEGQFTILSDSDATPYAGCQLDNFAFVAASLSDAEVADLGAYNARGIYGLTGLASEPSPAGEATDVLRDSDLSWTPAETAQTHDIYFGTNWDDVNDAGRTNPLEVLLSQNQTTTTLDLDRLEFGRTYYWRVDEVNGAPDNTIFKGSVWSFTVESFAYPIQNIIATSNAVSEATAGPENTVNGLGLNANDEHSIAPADMWLGDPVDGEPVAIMFEFDKVHKLHQMLVWNYNAQFEPLLGFGFKNATVEYSVDGVEWTILDDVELSQGTGMETYTANTAVDLGGVAARYVRLTVIAGFGTRGSFGLSEVRFLSIPVHASDPQPGSGALGVDVNTSLSWKKGREAVSHEVYLDTDEGAVADGTVLIATTGQSTADRGGLDLASTYYWKVNEVNDAEAISMWEGEIWSFTTAEFIVVDDFESYTDDIDAGQAIFLTWIDGYEMPGNGSTVGHIEAPFAETTIVHGARQSMPLFYDNSGVPVSEAVLTLGQNWTASGIKSLSLYFQGAEGNGGQLYVTINNIKVLYNGDAGDIAGTAWLPWTIDLSAVGGDLSNVTSLTIGIEGAGASGVVYIDDIELHP